MALTGSVDEENVMAIATRLPASTAAPVPGWVDRAAHVVPWTTVPSGLWRIALGFGVPVGFTGELAELYRAPGWITPYVIVLTLVIEALALLTLGLVKPWGEVLPRWTTTETTHDGPAAESGLRIGRTFGMRRRSVTGASRWVWRDGDDQIHRRRSR